MGPTNDDFIAAIQVLVSRLQGPSGRAASRERSLAVTKLQEAAMWLHADRPIDHSLLTPADPPKADLSQPVNPRKPQGMA